MSCYMIEPEAIDYLLCAAQAWRVNPHYDDEMQAVGTMLYEANRRSVAYRYPNEPEMASNPPYEWRTPSYAQRPAVHPVQVLKTLACLEYQSCEPPTWADSGARGWISKMRSEAIARIPGWNAAEWGAPSLETGHAIEKEQDEALRPAIRRAVDRDTLRLAETIRKDTSQCDVEGVRALARMLADAPEFARVDDDVMANLAAAKDYAFQCAFIARNGSEEENDEDAAERYDEIQRIINSISPAAPSLR